MKKLIVVALAAQCLLRTNSLLLADDAMKGEMGNMKDEMKAEKDAMRAKRHEMECKMKAHKDASEAHLAATAPMSAPAPTAAP